MMQSDVRWRRKLAFACYLLQLPPLVIFGVIYLSRSAFMPYHAVAVGQSWSDVDPAFQVLILALMRVAGGGFLAAACAMGILLFKPFKQGRQWAYWAIPAVGLISTLSSLYATVYVTSNTPASPPWIVAGLGAILLCTGFILSWPSMVRGKSQPWGNGA
jgi:hypothetical protein